MTKREVQAARRPKPIGRAARNAPTNGREGRLVHAIDLEAGPRRKARAADLRAALGQIDDPPLARIEH